jgi:hypothetical protein
VGFGSVSVNTEMNEKTHNRVFGVLALQKPYSQIQKTPKSIIFTLWSLICLILP